MTKSHLSESPLLSHVASRPDHPLLLLHHAKVTLLLLLHSTGPSSSLLVAAHARVALVHAHHAWLACNNNKRSLMARMKCDRISVVTALLKKLSLSVCARLVSASRAKKGDNAKQSSLI